MICQRCKGTGNVRSLRLARMEDMQVARLGMVEDDEVCPDCADAIRFLPEGLRDPVSIHLMKQALKPKDAKS